MSAEAKPGMRAIVSGRGTSIENNTREYHDGEEQEATLVKRIGNQKSDCWFVRMDGETETRCWTLVKLL